MKQYFLLFWALSCSCLSLNAQNASLAPESAGAVPSARQLAWHDMEYYAFVHFNMNTFTDKEWGNGKETPAQFNPTALDCRQWARTCKEAGMKAIIITAKHHDGFCLWPSKYSEHSVKNSPWKGGKGDVLKDLSEACKEYGLKMGVYLSPWDQNSKIYGKPEYNALFKNQLEEVLTNYGDIFEVWLDGAVGEEYIGKMKYDWPGIITVIRKNQPNAVIFSDAGPDIRWCGTEAGFVNETNYCTLNRDQYYPGTPKYLDLRSGNFQGSNWVPAEVDVSIRPGWYYHPTEDTEVKSPEHLELIYYHSVGRGGNMLLNIPVDRRGLIHEKDAASLKGLKEKLTATFSKNLISGALATATSQRGTDVKYATANLFDGDKKTFYAAKDGETSTILELNLPQARTFNVIELAEYLPLGQRISAVKILENRNNQWEVIGEATTVGSKRLINLPPTTTQQLRIQIDGVASPMLAELGLYYRPHANYLLESKSEFNQRMSWWRNSGFGMFIHWGLYAVPAGVYQGKDLNSAGEWIMNTAPIPVAEYEKYAPQFNPLKFNALEWVRIAKAAGMQYIVITSKHHDGFALWDSKTSAYDIMDATPFKRDILKELSDACKQEGIKLAFYHSIMDWHHPDAQGKNFPTYNTDKKKSPTWASYRENYLKPQLKELITKYQPAVLWFDGEWIPEWSEAQGKDLYQFVRSLKPDILVNNRVGAGRAGMQGMNKGSEYVGDFGTPEQEILAEGSNALDWESCMTMNETWGYRTGDNDWKSAETLIRNLADIAAKGGNYLLNVGPTAEGLIPPPSVERLKVVGEWMKENAPVVLKSDFYAAKGETSGVKYVQGQDGFAYVTFDQWPSSASLVLHKIVPESGSTIQILGCDQKLSWESFGGATTLFLPESVKAKCGNKTIWTLKIKGGNNLKP